MQQHKFTNKNLTNIKTSFFKKINQEQSELAYTVKKRKPLVGIVIAATLTLSLTIGILASNDIIDMSGIYQSFLGIGAENAGFNINTSYEKDGIELKLLSAVVDGNNGYIFYTIQDIEGDRLNGDIGWGLGDVDIHGLFKGYLLGGGIEIIHYDEETKTITAVMSVSSTKGISVNDKLTFSLRSISSGLKHYKKFETGVELHTVLSENEDPQATTEYSNNISSWSKPNESDITDKDIKEMPLLQKNALNISIEGIDWAIISNIGIIEDRLHIQYQYNENRSDYNGGYFSLYNQSDEEIYPIYSIYLGDYNDGYIEDIYNISSLDDLIGLSLKAGFDTSEEFIEGFWKIDFEVGSKIEEKTIEMKVLENIPIKNVTVMASPISTTIRFDVDRGSIDENIKRKTEVTNADNYLKLKDGSTIKLSMYRSMLDHEKNKGDIIYYNDFYDINELESIVLNGIEYYF